MQHFTQPAAVVAWLRAQGVQTLVCDSRHVSAGSGFVAWPGAAQDGRRYVPLALQAGAAACLLEEEGSEDFAYTDTDGRVAAVPNLKAVLGHIASEFYQHPSHNLAVVALTGTNGKTSTAWWIAQWLTALGARAGVAGTLGMGVPGEKFQATGLTTPDPVLWQAGLRTWLDAASVCTAVVEASSIGLQEGRLSGTRIHTAVFTNFTQDHLDYHHSMANYWAAKRALFDWPGLQAAVVNTDDPHGAQLADELQARVSTGAFDLWTVGMQQRAPRLQGRDWQVTETGARFVVQEQGDATSHTVNVPFVGQYNVHNLLSALAVVRAQGHALAVAVQHINALTAVPGRMQPVCPTSALAQPLLVVDYCHTPDALEKALQALRPLAKQRGGRVWCVVGCGGNRDASKRPLMAAIAEQHADGLILTSDNPRFEDPSLILQHMCAGLRGLSAVTLEPDRAQAIAAAVQQAAATDVVLLAGKGHEDYQEIAGKKWPFSDLEQGRLALHSWHAKQRRASP